jgi:hypothetical protein
MCVGRHRFKRFDVGGVVGGDVHLRVGGATLGFGISPVSGSSRKAVLCNGFAVGIVVFYLERLSKPLD